MTSRRIIILLKFIMVFSAVVLLSGCWDKLEIEERAVVLGIAIDVVPEAENESEGITNIDEKLLEAKKTAIKITAQIAVPGRIPLGPGEGGGQQDGEPVWAVSAVGRTVDGAIMALQQELADRIFLGHLRVIVISEEYARSGVQNMNDYFRRNPQVRRLSWIGVSQGPAEALMKAKPELERVPALYLLAMLDHAVDLGKYPNEFAGRFWSKSSSDGQEPHLPYLVLRENDKIMIDGMAVFQGDRMVGKTEPIEVGYFMGVTNTRQGGYSVYTSLPGRPEVFMFQATSRRSSTNVSVQNGVPVIDVAFEVEGDIREEHQEYSIRDDLTAIHELEQKMSEDARTAILDFIAQTQEWGADIFGFGEYVRAREPAFWNRHVQTKERWRTVYKDVKVNIRTDIKIRRLGMKEL